MKLRINMFGFIIILFVILIGLKIYYDSDVFNLRCIVSTVDGKKYCVRERKNVTKASNLLARTTEKLEYLVENLGQRYPDRDNVKRMVKNFNPTTIKETLPTSEYTAYSENKGEKLAFCLNKKKSNNDNLIDSNTLTFVAIHELGHIMTESVGHTDEFWQNFKFLLENAVELKLYTPVDYKKEPENYCGMDITDNPYYDL
jgi:predicted metal-dependent hydrolase|tara:strand:- start:2866 stop:3465 length:600 start_codon:yes stop_codon:yes gene_type:complete